jgi:NarL family two-component system response regulator LiaR
VTENIRVLIADDHALVREGLRRLLISKAGLDVVGQAGNGREAVEQARQLQPDVILLDLVMPDMDGIQAIKHIKQDNPQARILMLTSFSGDRQVYDAVKAGAMGYLLKDSSPQDLVDAISRVYHGEISLQPDIARKLVQEISRPPDAPAAEEPLTEREVEVLQMVAQGRSNQEIAEELYLSERTVRTHVSHILNKLHLANRTQAALYALRTGLSSMDTD